MLPSDICQIYKKGTKIRMDTSIATINELSMKRGDISFLFDALAKEENRLYVLDNKMKVIIISANILNLNEGKQDIEFNLSLTSKHLKIVDYVRWFSFFLKIDA